MRVAMVITGLGVGGAERQVIDLSASLSERGLDVLIVSLLPPSDWAMDKSAPDVRIESLGLRRGVPDVRAIIRLRRVLDGWQPDIVHSHMIHANIVARFARLGARWPLVSTIHNVPSASRWIERLQAATQRLSVCTTLVSQDALEEHVTRSLVSLERARVIYNGVDLRRFATEGVAPGGASQFMWTSIGSLTRQKDHLTLLRAVSQISDEERDHHVRIAGTGDLGEMLLAEAHQLGIGDRATMLGHVDDIPGLLATTDAVVSSSVHEGLPVALIEAAAAARPIVATDAGGTREIVQSHSTGFVTSVGDAKDLARAMEEIMAMQPQALAKMGDEGRAWARGHFDMVSVTDQWITVYESESDNASRGARLS